jgi:hypothetical protein
MRSLIYDSRASIEDLLRQGFLMPIHLAAVGTNGGVVAGTYSMSPAGPEFTCEITVQAFRLEGLTAPVNTIYVDSKGQSALVVLRQDENVRGRLA